MIISIFILNHIIIVKYKYGNIIFKNKLMESIDSWDFMLDNLSKNFCIPGKVHHIILLYSV